jgi:transcription initiation factor IIE alpha subunit
VSCRRNPLWLTETRACRLRDDDLSYLMNTNPKELAKLCAKLRQDRFITVYAPEASLRSPPRRWRAR